MTDSFRLALGGYARRLLCPFATSHRRTEGPPRSGRERSCNRCSRRPASSPEGRRPTRGSLALWWHYRANLPAHSPARRARRSYPSRRSASSTRTRRRHPLTMPSSGDAASQTDPSHIDAVRVSRFGLLPIYPVCTSDWLRLVANQSKCIDVSARAPADRDHGLAIARARHRPVEGAGIVVRYFSEPGGAPA